MNSAIRKIFTVLWDTVCAFAQAQLVDWAHAALDWLLSHVQRVCERIAAAIAEHLSASDNHLDESTVRSQIVARLGSVMSDIGARLAANAETMSPEEALEHFQHALTANAVLA